ncbi:RND family efflux transporter, MFP subunit [Phyllobacterium sp. CL33Tsu]|uniref:efflux RND transporter periplasmic adaptor subunit n=1 Tax=Phyllobacterium sp. CL33Tsu TaxID=1798191 RepID=UPI0008E6DB6E|nr:efflux RND transporter periplasmic adaptor subunit [Phyllobacterium sp. CL33Tsu]SFJ17362.1 RND family efflux transporter, MFP subunit [Phyllobacterium sp. CL33Tsu]
MFRALFITGWIGVALLSNVGTVSAQDVQQPVRGLVRAIDDALISTELNARIVEITRREGEGFKKGEVLITFDCGKYQTELNAARAEVEFNKIALNNSIELDKRKAIGRFDVQQNRAKYEKAQAQAGTLAVQVAECTISAPFDGRIAEMRAKAYEMSKPNEPLMRLVNTDRLEIELIVTSLWLQWIKPGLKFRVTVDETDTVHDATVQRIAATVDSVSQTVKIMAVFAESSPNILPGMSLSAELKQPGTQR